MAHRLFEGAVHAANYSKFRPTYPSEVFDLIIGFMKEEVSSSFDLAVDIGCGSGQSTRPLAQHFKNIIGIDISQAQVDNANKNEQTSNITYRVGSEQQMPLAASSVDLVATGQAAHWFDPVQNFYNEAHRVLRENGCLVLYGYGVPTLMNNANGPQLNDVFDKFYKSMWNGKYWDPQRKLVDDHYSAFTLPYKHFRRMEIEMSYNMSLLHFIGYIQTWSSFQKYQKENDDSDQMMQTLLQSFLQTFSDSTSPDSAMVKVTWPVFVLIGKKVSNE